MTAGIGKRMNARVGKEPGWLPRVAVWATDPITRSGVTDTLKGRARVFAGASECAEQADVLVFAADQVDAELLATMRCTFSGSTAPAVLVANQFEPCYLLDAVECRVVAVLHRSVATEDRLVGAINVALENGGAQPVNLLPQVQRLQEKLLTPHGITAAGLTQREIDVVRWLAEGLGTEEIAGRLGFSERTVKTTIHGLTRRLKVRNRSQLVAHGMRAGVV